MTRPELTELHRVICEKARELQIAKNKDYAHDLDIFRNFRRYGTFGVLVRLSDKLARLDSFEENKEFAVADEKLEDTIIDIINYATIYLAMKQEDKSPPPKVIEITVPKVVDGPYCRECEGLAEFRLEIPLGVFYYCELCAESGLCVMDFNRLTALDKL